jgi:hypothetical protein
MSIRIECSKIIGFGILADEGVATENVVALLGNDNGTAILRRLSTEYEFYMFERPMEDFEPLSKFGYILEFTDHGYWIRHRSQKRGILKIAWEDLEHEARWASGSYVRETKRHFIEIKDLKPVFKSGWEKYLIEAIFLDVMKGKVMEIDIDDIVNAPKIGYVETQHDKNRNVIRIRPQFYNPWEKK